MISSSLKPNLVKSVYIDKFLKYEKYEPLSLKSPDVAGLVILSIFCLFLLYRYMTKKLRRNRSKKNF